MSTGCKIHHLNNKEEKSFLDRSHFDGHWRFKTKRRGLHKYKLAIDICIVELLGPAGAAMPQEDQQLCHLELRLLGEKQRSFSPGQQQLETSAFLVDSVRWSHGILGQAANQRSSYHSHCL